MKAEQTKKPEEKKILSAGAIKSAQNKHNQKVRKVARFMAEPNVIGF